MTVPIVIGSQQDKKFRQALAALLFVAPESFLYQYFFQNSGALTDEIVYSKDFQSTLFGKVGDGLQIEFFCKFAGNANAKSFKVEVQQSDGTPLAIFSVAPVGVNATTMSCKVSFILVPLGSTGNCIGVFGHAITSEAANYYQTLTLGGTVYNGALKLVVLATGGASSDLIFGDFRGIFIPGIN